MTHGSASTGLNLERVPAVIIDDTELNSRIYAAMIKKAGVTETFTFTASENGLAWCAEHDVALLIVDYQMAPPDGLEVIDRFRKIQHNTDTQIIMITGDHDRDVRYRALGRGVSDFLTKPVDPPELIARVRNLLALRESRQSLKLQASYLADQTTWLAAEVRKVTRKLRERERETICGLTRAAEFRDRETGMHIVRMALFASELAKAVGLSDDEQDMLQLAAPMHDIGKVATPDYILLKQGPLSEEEWAIMRRHTIAGYEILKDTTSELLRRGAEIALTHHERFDGSGYPYGLSGDAIPVSGQICAICDVFDALTSTRPYKPEWSVELALEQISVDSGRHFDSRLVDAFLSIVPKVTEIRQRYVDVA
jgi:response regulator RpfG family c-di-GMP phosphodiesterase